MHEAQVDDTNMTASELTGAASLLARTVSRALAAVPDSGVIQIQWCQTAANSKQ